MAIRLVPAAKGTKGAKAYVSPTWNPAPAGGLTPAGLAAAYGYNRTVRRGRLRPSRSSTHTTTTCAGGPEPFRRSTTGLPAETAMSFRKVNQNGDRRRRCPPTDTGWSTRSRWTSKLCEQSAHSARSSWSRRSRTADRIWPTAVNTAAHSGPPRSATRTARRSCPARRRPVIKRPITTPASWSRHRPVTTAGMTGTSRTARPRQLLGQRAERPCGVPGRGGRWRYRAHRGRHHRCAHRRRPSGTKTDP